MRTLRELSLHEDAVVRAVRLSPELAEWLAAVGLEPGVTVRVLRRASFGGPLHVRTGDDGEFAVAAALAESIVVSPSETDPAERVPSPSETDPAERVPSPSETAARG